MIFFHPVRPVGCRKQRRNLRLGWDRVEHDRRFPKHGGHQPVRQHQDLHRISAFGPCHQRSDGLHLQHLLLLHLPEYGGLQRVEERPGGIRRLPQGWNGQLWSEGAGTDSVLVKKSGNKTSTCNSDSPSLRSASSSPGTLARPPTSWGWRAVLIFGRNWTVRKRKYSTVSTSSWPTSTLCQRARWASRIPIWSSMPCSTPSCPRSPNIDTCWCRPWIVSSSGSSLSSPPSSLMPYSPSVPSMLREKSCCTVSRESRFVENKKSYFYCGAAV